MVEKIKNGEISLIPKQKSTYGGITVIIQQLIQILNDIPVGGWVASLSAEGVTYGSLLLAYWPIVAGIILILFNEEKLKDLIN